MTTEARGERPAWADMPRTVKRPPEPSTVWVGPAWVLSLTLFVIVAFVVIRYG